MDSDLYISNIFALTDQSTADGYLECSLVKFRKLLAKYDFMS